MYQDPVTGDELTRLEFYTRQVQTVVRTPWFILAFNLVTLGCIILNLMLAWNDLASYLAIVIEWLVGTYMFGQTGRDAVYIRRIAHVEEVNEIQLAHLEKLLSHFETERPPSEKEKLLEAAGLDLPGDRQTGLHREAAEATERRPGQAASDPS